MTVVDTLIIFHNGSNNMMTSFVTETICLFGFAILNYLNLFNSIYSCQLAILNSINFSKLVTKKPWSYKQLRK